MSEIKIALVDSHTIFRESLAMLVNDFPGYQVAYQSGNGQQFISMLDEKDLPEIVLINAYTPDVDGSDTTTWLQKNYPQIKILALGAGEPGKDISEILKLGASGYILMEAGKEDLKQAFDALAAGGNYFPPQRG